MVQKKNKCSICGEPYEYQNKISYDENGKVIGCWHDNDFISINWEITELKKQREKYAKDLIQPYKDGKVNSEFKKAYPNSEIFK